jgi:ferredoxin
MAKKTVKRNEGVYEVNDECIGCETCIEIAPNNFGINKKAKTAFVKKQPSTATERVDCKEAMEACPVEAIVLE